MFDVFSTIGGIILLAALPSIHFMEWRSVLVLYLTAFFALFGSSALLDSHPSIVHALASHPTMMWPAWEYPRPFYWLGADSDGNPVIMELGEPGAPSVPYFSEARAAGESITPYVSEWNEMRDEMRERFRPGIVDELELCPEKHLYVVCLSYFYTHEDGVVVPVNETRERIVGLVVRVVLEQVFGLLGALVGYWGGENRSSRFQQERG